MFHMLFRFLPVILIFSSILSCAANIPKIEPSNYVFSDDDQTSLSPPQECRHMYISERPVVAVSTFINNTSYGDMNQITTDSQTTGVFNSVGMGRSYGGGGSSVLIGAGATVFTADTDKAVIARSISPMLGEYAQSSIEDVLVKIGGVDVVSRSKLDQIFQEQQFQMTLADPETAVEFGKLLGAQYIITGTVDNIQASYTQPVSPILVTSSDRNTAAAGLAVFMASVVYNAAAAGWDVETTMTVNVIDVSNGKIMKSEQLKGKSSAGASTTIKMDQLIAAAKNSMGESMDNLVKSMSGYFELKGYVNEIRGGKSIALISLGSNQGIRPGDKLYPYIFNISTDFRTGEKSCTLSKVDLPMVVSDNIDLNHAWVAISKSDKQQLKKISVGTIVKRSPIEKVK